MMNDFERKVIIDFLKDLIRREHDDFPEFSINTGSQEFQGVLHILNIDLSFLSNLIYEEKEIERLVAKARENAIEAARGRAKATTQFLRGMYPEVYNHFDKEENEI